jgi:hypothetical protein
VRPFHKSIGKVKDYPGTSDSRETLIYRGLKDQKNEEFLEPRNSAFCRREPSGSVAFGGGYSWTMARQRGKAGNQYPLISC